MKCLICKKELPVESENYWLREESKNGFRGQRVYYGSKNTGLAAQRAVLDSADVLSAMRELAINDFESGIHIPIEQREKTTIYNFPIGEAAYPVLILRGVIAARFEHESSGVIIEFHLCQDKNWELLANIRNISIDSHAFTYLRQARKFLQLSSPAKNAKVSLDVLILAAQKCKKVTDEALADGISHVTGEAVTKGAVKMWRKRNSISLDYLRSFHPKSINQRKR